MQPKKRYKPKPERLTKADERANLEFLLSNEPCGSPLATLRELKTQLEQAHADWSGKKLPPLLSAEELFKTPARALFLVRDLSDQIFESRTDILFYKATHEFIDFRIRGVALFNDLSEAGVKYFLLNREAEDWARSKLSGRVVKADASIRAARRTSK